MIEMIDQTGPSNSLEVLESNVANDGDFTSFASIFDCYFVVLWCSYLANLPVKIQKKISQKLIHTTLYSFKTKFLKFYTLMQSKSDLPTSKIQNHLTHSSVDI